MSSSRLILKYFPSFSEGLSLRATHSTPETLPRAGFPFLFGGTFIEGILARGEDEQRDLISLPFRRDFH